jgi:hypothetical protein
MTTSSSVSWQDFFSRKPCEHGFSRFAEAIEKHGIEAAVKRASVSSRRWGAEHTYRADILLILAQDEDVYVRCCVALNAHTSAEALSALAQDEDYDVRYRVASNPQTPAEVLATLATDEDYYIRYRVAQNAHTPVETLSALAQDAVSCIRSIAQDRLRPTGF